MWLLILIAGAGCTRSGFGEQRPPDAAGDMLLVDGLPGNPLDVARERAPLDRGADRGGFETASDGPADLPRDSPFPSTSDVSFLPFDTRPPPFDGRLPPPDADLVSCTAKYGKVPGFALCSETATSCVLFYKVSPSKGCNTLCAIGGGKCIEAWDASIACVLATSSSCSDTHRDGACRCSR